MSSRQPQGHMDEEVLHNDRIVGMVEAWDKKNNAARATKKIANDAKAEIDALFADKPAGIYRLDESDFVYTVKVSDPRSVAFDTEGGKRSTRITKPKAKPIAAAD